MLSELLSRFSDPPYVTAALAVLVILSLVVGYLFGSRRRKRPSAESRKGDDAFFKGVQYILSNDHDQAIEEFTKSVQINSDTIETHVALGNLYRSRGDIERAIRIRQNIIVRPNLAEGIRIRALTDLGLDYRKGGFLNWALDTFLMVLKKQPSNPDVLREVEKIYEELKDWGNAFATRQKIARIEKGDHGHILAHHQTEMGKAAVEKGELTLAKSHFTKALSFDPGCVDAYLHLGDLYFAKQDYTRAITSWKKAVDAAPKLTFLALDRLEGAYSRMKNLKPVEDFLRECAASYSDPFTHMALARYLLNEQDAQAALRELRIAIDLDPSFWEARKFQGEILLDRDMTDQALDAYRDLISHLNVPYLTFQCIHCGFSPTELQWQCPQCKRWDTVALVDARESETDAPHEPQTTPPEIAQKVPEDVL